MAPIYLGKRVLPSSLRYIENLARWLVHQRNINTCQYVEQAGSLLSYLFYLLLTKWRLPCFCLALQ